MELRSLAIAALAAVAATAVAAQTVTFDDLKPGPLPAEWLVTLTGKGAPKFDVEVDANGPTGTATQVVRQSGVATYPLALLKASALQDGYVEVKFKALEGKEDRAAGVIWRARDANNYYIARANALEDNVVLYKTLNGKRNSIPLLGQRGGYGTKAPVPPNQWHTLRVDFAGTRHKVIYNGRLLFEVEDSTFKEAGMVGLWTKADSVTLFDDFEYGQTKP